MIGQVTEPRKRWNLEWPRPQAKEDQGVERSTCKKDYFFELHERARLVTAMPGLTTDLDFVDKCPEKKTVRESMIVTLSWSSRHNVGNRDKKTQLSTCGKACVHSCDSNNE